MQQTFTSTNIGKRGGGRVSSAAYRASQAMSEEFIGLEEDVDRFQLLVLVKRVGRWGGFTPRMIALLDYYVAYSRQQDWALGKRPIVYQSVHKTAVDLGVSERQIQKLERQLFDVGALTWRDSGNHRRYGQRDPETGELLYAFGVDLSPLAYLRETLQAKLHEKQLYDAVFDETKRNISYQRRQIRAMLLELGENLSVSVTERESYEQEYQRHSRQIRAHMPLEEVRGLLSHHQDLTRRLEATLTKAEPIASADQPKQNSKKFVQERSQVRSHIETTYQSFTEVNTGSPPAGQGSQGSVTKPLERQNQQSPNEEGTNQLPFPSQPTSEQIAIAAGLQHITLKQVLLASSERFRAYLPPPNEAVNWSHFVDAAYRLRPQLDISQTSWADACEVLGRNGAAVCLLLTDHAAQRSEHPVEKPAAYFRSLINRAGRGELHLHRSVFGLCAGPRKSSR